MSNQTLRSVVKIVLFSSLLLVQSCVIQWPIPQQRPTPKPQLQPVDLPGGVRPDSYGPFELPAFDLSASQKEIADFHDELNTLVKNNNFEGLEQKAKEYRDNKSRLIGGGWKIHEFYSVVSEPSGDHLGDADWEAKIKAMSVWKRRMPNSITARTALANAQLGYAEIARGTDWASKVSEKDMELFQARLTTVATELDDAAKLEVKCPVYYELVLAMIRDQGLGLKTYEDAFDKAVAYDPTYYYFYTHKAVTLMPRWYGQPGDWETFAARIKNQAGNPLGGQLYYLMVEYVSDLKSEDFMRENKILWKETREGFRSLVSEYGASRWRLNDFGKLANKVGDPWASCSTFNMLQGEDDYEPNTWFRREYFENAKRFGKDMCKFVELKKRDKSPDGRHV